MERNALRAELVARAEDWRSSSLWHRMHRSREITLDTWPVPRGRKWLDSVNAAETEAELKAFQRSVKRGTRFGTTSRRVSQFLDLAAQQQSDPNRTVFYGAYLNDYLQSPDRLFSQLFRTTGSQTVSLLPRKLAPGGRTANGHRP